MRRRQKKTLSVVLYLDIKNAFNAINHSAVFYILEAQGFPEEDIALFQRMYTGSFLVMVKLARLTSLDEALQLCSVAECHKVQCQVHESSLQCTTRCWL